MTDTPIWTAFDPDAPPGLTDLAGAGLVVGIVASSAAADEGWTAALATDLASAWSRDGVRLILADGALDAPSLHEAVGIPNGEGIADALVFGASVRRVAQRVKNDGYFVVCAGTVVADAAEAMAGGRWTHLCAGFREAGVTLAVYLHGEDPAAEIALREVSHVVVLTEEGEALPSVVSESGAEVIAVVGRDAHHVAQAMALSDDDSGGAGAAGEPALDEERFEDDASGEAAFTEEQFEDDASGEAAFSEEQFEEDASGEAAFTAESLEEDASGEAVSDEEPSDEQSPGEVGFTPEAMGDPLDGATLEAPLAEDVLDPGDKEEQIFQRAMENAERDEEPVAALDEILQETEGKSSGRRNVLILVLLVVVAGSLAAGWFGYVEIPGITPTGESATPVVVSDAPVAAAPAAVNSPVQAYSVALGSYGSPGAAEAVVAQLRTEVPSVVFTAVPVEVGGRTFHRALAGPAVDSAAAAGLWASVADATGRDPSEWVVRSTPLAYELGEMPELDAAVRRAEVLQSLEVPAYVLAVDYDDGSTRYRVYAGAYADEAEAAALLGLLTDRGLNAANLSDRKGRLPE